MTAREKNRTASSGVTNHPKTDVVVGFLSFSDVIKVLGLRQMERAFSHAAF